MKEFPLLIKPASADCNLRCTYCFYIDHLAMNKSIGGGEPRMSIGVLEKLVSSYMSLPFNQYIFNWQGGEPTLMGLDFFKEVVQLQKIYGHPGASVGNGLQTNGVLIDDEAARFYNDYNFLLGVSLDGPAVLHDHYRKYLGGKPTHRRVMQGIDHLRKHEVAFNILCLVNDLVVMQPDKVYGYYREKGLNFLQFIPCVEYNSRGEMLPFSITGDQWGKFLCRIFDLWKRKDTRRVSIRLFDSIMNYLVDGTCTSCDMEDNCCQYFVVEYDGGVFPCDFHVREDLQLGNIMDDSWQKLASHPLYREFGKRKRCWPSACDGCDYLPLCHGDCLRMRGVGDDFRDMSVLCEGWKMFYQHSLPTFIQLAEDIKKMRG